MYVILVFSIFVFYGSLPQNKIKKVKKKKLFFSELHDINLQL